MTKTNLGRQLSDVEWARLLARQPGAGFYAVITTGIVCCHGCPARTPLRHEAATRATIFTTLR